MRNSRFFLDGFSSGEGMLTSQVLDPYFFWRAKAVEATIAARLLEPQTSDNISGQPAGLVMLMIPPKGLSWFADRRQLPSPWDMPMFIVKSLR